MTQDDPQSFKELIIFSHFSKVCGLPIRPASIEKRKPPEPDILCEIEGEGSVAFEMVELIDEDFARQTYSQIKIQQLLEKAYDSLQTDVHEFFKRKLHNAHIYVTFHSTSTSPIREKSILMILNTLVETDNEFEGIIQFPTDSPLSKTVKYINIGRGAFLGPCFDVAAAGSFGDPTFERIAAKFKKKYKTIHPIELLTYYELQPVLPEYRWLPGVQDYVRQNIHDSLFRRVWIFDLSKKAIIFSS